MFSVMGGEMMMDVDIHGVYEVSRLGGFWVRVYKHISLYYIESLANTQLLSFSDNRALRLYISLYKHLNTPFQLPHGHLELLLPKIVPISPPHYTTPRTPRHSQANTNLITHHHHHHYPPPPSSSSSSPPHLPPPSLPPPPPQPSPPTSPTSQPAYLYPATHPLHPSTPA